MQQGARIAAAIGLIDAFLGGAENMDRLLLRWGRESRYAGSGDRRTVADLCYDVLRRLRSASWAGGSRAPSGRAALLGLVGPALFTGEGHAPAPLAPGEGVPPGEMPEAVALDCPDWLMAPLRAALGADAAPVLAALRERAPLWLRVNTRKADVPGAVAALASDGIATEPGGGAALRVAAGGGGLSRSRTYAAGLVEIQDLASQRVAAFAGAAPGETVLDFCAGGGGKTLALGAAMGGQGRLLAHDADPARMADLWPRAERAGLAVARGAPEALTGACDLVLADAPCSGSGAWRRNPDAKWRLTPARLDALLAMQDRVLDAAARCVRPGGRLVYATCSLLADENGARVAAFLGRHPGFVEAGSCVLTPLDGGDGFFAARLIRT